MKSMTFFIPDLVKLTLQADDVEYLLSLLDEEPQGGQSEQIYERILLQTMGETPL